MDICANGKYLHFYIRSSSGSVLHLNIEFEHVWPSARQMNVAAIWQLCTVTAKATRTEMDAHQELLHSLNQLLAEYPPAKVHTKGGIYYGALSIALLLRTLLSMYGPELQLEGNVSLQGAFDAYIARAAGSSAVQSAEPSPFVFAASYGVIDSKLALLALTASPDNLEPAQALVENALQAAETTDNQLEWLYGLAGLLYFLRFVKSSSSANANIARKIDTAIDAIVEQLIQAPRPWTWHGKAYLGAAHGSAGIITQIILSRPSAAARLEDDILDLLKQQKTFKSGNVPSSKRSPLDRLVQFCHGAPGVVSSFLSIRQHLSPELRKQVDASVEVGQQCTARHGLLAKESCLCHGAAGNALALDPDTDAFQSLLNASASRQVRQDVAYGKTKLSDHPEGLYTGLAGRVWLWALVDKNKPLRYLGYNEI